LILNKGDIEEESSLKEELARVSDPTEMTANGRNKKFGRPTRENRTLSVLVLKNEASIQNRELRKKKECVGWLTSEIHQQKATNAEVQKGQYLGKSHADIAKNENRLGVF